MPLIRLIRSQQSVAQINCIRRKVSFKTIQFAHRHAFQRHGVVECLAHLQIQGLVEFLAHQFTSKAVAMPAHFDLMQRIGLKFIFFNVVQENAKNQSVEFVRIGLLSAALKILHVGLPN